MIKMFFETIKILWGGISTIMVDIFGAIWELIPEIIQIKQILSYFTPQGMLALAIGVPISVIVITWFIVRKLIINK